VIARLAWRILWRHRRRTIITVASITLGLTCVILFVSLAEGVYGQLIDDAVRMQAGHITLEHPAYRDAPAVDLRIGDVAALRRRIEGLPRVERTKALVLGQGVARSGAGAVGIAMLGVEPAAEVGSSPLARRIIAGTYLDGGDGAHVVVGAELAARLDLAAGKKLVLASNDASGALVEALFRVKGIFRTGSDEIDGYVVQAPLAAVQRLYGLGPDEVTQLGVVIRDPDAQQRALAEIRALAPAAGVAVRPWQEVLPELAAFIRLDRTSDHTFQGLLLFLCLFTIFNTLLMSVLEREREFAVLLALGTRPAQLRLQVLAESAYIALLGCALGLLIGGLWAYAIQIHGWDVSGLYSEGLTISGLAVSTRLHAKVTLRLLAWVGGIVFTATVLSSLPPMRRAARVSVAETLR
jgi:ABC-type lipoprotein release transport system permease subunit